MLRLYGLPHVHHKQQEQKHGEGKLGTIEEIPQVEQVEVRAMGGGGGGGFAGGCRVELAYLDLLRGKVAANTFSRARTEWQPGAQMG